MNEALRFYDPRLGQSTTMTGRCIVRHMGAKINEVVTGEYDYLGEICYYQDTDSCYFSMYSYSKDKPEFSGIDWNNREQIIELYDAIAEQVNDSFPSFMQQTFNTTFDRGKKIKAGRELLASKALFIKKKKYAVLMYEYDGHRYDVGDSPGKLKAMGLETKRSDTPKYMQKFLEDLLMDLLQGKEYQHMFDKIKEFRKAFVSKPAWEKGTPKAVNNMGDFTERLEQYEKLSVDDKSRKLNKKGKVTVDLPGHVKASIIWNRMLEMNRDKYSLKISDGTKVIVCKIKPNPMKMGSLTFDSIAYPIDEPHLPQWFKDLPFDEPLMEETIIDNKIDNIFGVLGWDINDTKEKVGDEFFSF